MLFALVIKMIYIIFYNYLINIIKTILKIKLNKKNKKIDGFIKFKK